MTANDFNKKWSKYLEKGFYGMAINNDSVIKYLDSEFENEIKINPSFSYSQIKIKFNTSRVYAKSDKTAIWENKINEIILNETLKNSK